MNKLLAGLWILVISLITADNYKNDYFHKGLLIESMIDAFFKTVFLMALSVLLAALTFTLINGGWWL